MKTRIYNLIFLVHLTGSMQGPYEKKLLHHLLDKYNVLERPVSNESDPIQISFGITLMQIIDVVIIFPTFLLRFLVE
jgi:nicotinic acetylcholine receptor